MLYKVHMVIKVFAENEGEAIKKALDCLKSDADYEMADIIGVE
jgi:hypothetical protein